VVGASDGRVGEFAHDAKKFADAADEQTLLVDLDPGTGRRREHDVITAVDRHFDADVVPPIEARADREHDPVLGWRLVVTGRNQKAGATYPIRVELLDHDSIEEGTQFVAHAAMLTSDGIAMLRG
jgi:hypothetical protein